MKLPYQISISRYAISILLFLFQTTIEITIARRVNGCVRGQEFSDPKDECYKYVCNDLRNDFNHVNPYKNLGWNRSFDERKCCKYDDINIPVGETAQITDLNRNIGFDKVDNKCSGRFATCQEAGFDSNHPNIIIHYIDNVNCCTYKNKSILFKETILDAEQCSKISCVAQEGRDNILGIDIETKSLIIKIDKLFDHECGCCEYNGALLKKGETIKHLGAPNSSLNKDKNWKEHVLPSITCIKGTLYTLQEVRTELENIEKDDRINDHLKSSEDNEIRGDININQYLEDVNCIFKNGYPTSSQPTRMVGFADGPQQCAELVLQFAIMQRQHFVNGASWNLLDKKCLAQFKISSIEKDDFSPYQTCIFEAWPRDKSIDLNDNVDDTNNSDDIKHTAEACVENTILEKLYETIITEIKNNTIANIAIIADENNDDTDMVLSTITLLLPFLSKATTFLTWYSYELNECSYAYSVNDEYLTPNHCHTKHLWPRLTQFKRQNEDNILPENWKFKSLVDGLQNSYMNIKDKSDSKNRSLFLLIVSTPNLNFEEHEKWIQANIPIEAIRKISSEGHSIIVICVSSNQIFFRTFHSTGFHKTSSAQELKYLEYGMEKELERVNMCLNNCTEEEFVEKELRDGYEKMQYMLTSNRCNVKGHKSLENLVSSTFSLKCKDVISNGPICNLKHTSDTTQNWLEHNLASKEDHAYLDNQKENEYILTEDSKIAKQSGEGRKDWMGDDYYDTREEYYLDSVSDEEDDEYESSEEDNFLKKETNSFFPFTSLFESDYYDEPDNTASKAKNENGMDGSANLDILQKNQGEFERKPSYLKNQVLTKYDNDYYKTHDTWNNKKPQIFSFGQNGMVKNIQPQRNGARRNGFSDWIKDFERRYL